MYSLIGVVFVITQFCHLPESISLEYPAKISVTAGQYAIPSGTPLSATFTVNDQEAYKLLSQLPVSLARQENPDQSIPAHVSKVPDTKNRLRIDWIESEISKGKTNTYLIVAKTEIENQTKSPRRVTFKEIQDDPLPGLQIEVNGEPFTTYRTKNVPCPYFWPLFDKNGLAVTRDYPIKEGTPGEKKDHPHHTSMWFTHRDINGLDFWHHIAKNSGKTVHTEYQSIDNSDVRGTFVSNTDWVEPDGKTILMKDVRTVSVYATNDHRILDFEIVLTAQDKEVVFHDDKDGLFGIRVAGTMKVEQEKGIPRGTILNANGDTDLKAWGKQTPWCDYYGPVDGKTVGIAIFDHPDSFRYPTYWHVRTYGLYAANPFGLSYFTKKKKDGTAKLQPGEKMRFKYRVFIHDGTTQEAKVEDYFNAFANPPKIEVTMGSN